MVVGIDNRHEMFQLLQIICQIDTHMKTKPEWWGDGLDLEDNSPVLEIAKKLTEAQLEFAREKSGGKVGGKKEDGEGTV